MENQLIVYTPKKNIKKTIFKILLILFISFSIFIVAALCSASIFIRLKWNETKDVDLHASTIKQNHIILEA